MKNLYFIRHGQASFGTGDYDRLSEIGFRQARLLGNFFRDTNQRFHALFSGTLLRQQQTAQAVMESLDGETPPLEVMASFNEFDSEAVLRAQMEDLSRENPDLALDLQRIGTDPGAFRRVFERALGRLLGDDGPMTRDLSLTAFFRRVRAGVDAVAARLAEDESAAIFTSGGTLAAVMHAALALEEKETVRLGWQIRNASVSRFRHGDGRLTLASFNGTAHLEKENDPSLLTYL